MLQGLCFGRLVSARNLVCFPCKVAAADDERDLVCATGAAAVEPRAIGSSSVLCNEWCVVRAQFYALLEPLWLLIAVEWLHECCYLLCCHMRREMRVGDVKLQNAL